MKTRLAFVLIALCHVSQGNKLAEPQSPLKATSPSVRALEKPGECPAPKEFFGSCPLDAKSCLSDKDCLYGKKCCSDQCGLTCKRALLPPPTPLEKPGECPAPSEPAGICSLDVKSNCSSDQDCLYGKKCCSDHCGLTCKRPLLPPPTPDQILGEEKPGECPAPSEPVGICSIDVKSNCTSDQDCLYGKKCCSDQCGLTCKRPLLPLPSPTPTPSDQSLGEEKPGQCPAPSDSIGICSFDPKTICSNDQDCLYGKKCCTDQCGQTCKKPLTTPTPTPRQSLGEEKPRQCPVPSDPIGFCTFDPKTNCINDSECLDGGKKCCWDGCRKTCISAIQVLPIQPTLPRQPQVKPGQCPTPSKDGGICIFDPDTNCIGDQDCLDDKKCCYNGCGRSCKNVVQVSPPSVSLVPPHPPSQLIWTN